MKSLKSSSGTFTQKEPLSLEDIDKLKVREGTSLTTGKARKTSRCHAC